MDLLDEPSPGDNAPEFTVSEISGAVKRVIEGEFGRIRVRGEISRIVRARSGHMYYDIKDDRSVLACTTWKGQIEGLGVTPEEGLEVVVTGRMTTFGAQSKYNMNVDRMAVAGAGALMAMLERRKQALRAEGLFDEARKRPLPFLPGVIGVITSPQGAVIRDILHRLRDRFPTRVLIWPVAVQGKDCAPQVARAIAGFNALTPGGALPRPDLLIVARGGGSIEDLWGFNEEIVVRAAAASAIPLISAVGHETDTTLIDYASDKRAPTPTAAAEMAVPVRLDLLAWLADQAARLERAQTQGLARRKERLRDLSRPLPRADSLLSAPRQRLDFAAERLPVALRGLTERRRSTLLALSGVLRPATLRARLDREAERLEARAGRLAPALSRLIETRADRLARRADALRPAALAREIARARRDLAGMAARLARIGPQPIGSARERLAACARMLDTLSYQATLARGFVVVHGPQGPLTRRDPAAAAGPLELEFHDGRLSVMATDAPRPAPKPRKAPPGQGSLF